MNAPMIVELAVGVVALLALVLAVLSSWWTGYHDARILRRALGHEVREADTTSLKTWMGLRDDQIADAEQELARNPFDGPLDVVEALGERLSPPPQDQ